VGNDRVSKRRVRQANPKSIYKTSSSAPPATSNAGFVLELKLPPADERTNAVEINGHGYVLSPSFQAGEGLLTISLRSDGPLEATAEVREETLARLLRCSSMIFTGRTHSIPISWRPFHHKNRIAFQADRKVRAGGRTDAGRVVMEVTQDSGPRLFAFLLEREGDEDLAAFRADTSLLREALAGIREAVACRPQSVTTALPPGQLGNLISLEPPVIGAGAPHVSLDDWYNARLTVNQRKFVDYPLPASVRLIGPAGSGKTVAMVVKCLRELRTAAERGKRLRLLFLTHASSTATAVENLALEMDPATALDGFAADPPGLVVSTIYSLADRYMRYDLDQLSPVSLDGYEGRSFQAEILNDVIEQEIRADWIAYRSRCSAPFVAYMEADKDSIERRFFLWELLNEFANVLDAEGVRSSAERREKYLTDKRRAWMMVLNSREERDVVLRLYDQFRSWLREAKAIGSDQMVADFLNYLDSYKWEATRAKEGFDAVFVDELHLFNRQERMLLRHLLRDAMKPPAVFMAYDAKQSPRDTFLGLPQAEAQKYDLWRDARLGKTEKIELVDVFRYTPQIAQALSIIDQSFPGQDLDSDWPAYSGIAQTADGPIPLVCELPNFVSMYGVVFKRAKILQQRLARDRHVAVLCCSYDLFQRYIERPELRRDFHPITSRDEALGIPYSRKKFLFSMPEYVAGLQYDTVLLIDVNRGEVPEGPYSVAALRKFASQVYLGASRAERRLEIYSSLEHGGIAPILSVAMLQGALERTEVDHLPSK
jgi:hypothetical protein